MSSPEIMLDPKLMRPKEPLTPRVLRWVAFFIIVVPLVWSAAGLGVTWESVAKAPGQVLRMFRATFPPDLSPETIQRALPKVMESLFIAWIGTMIAAVISLPLAFVAARNTGNKIAGGFVRFLFIIIRTIPELVLAMFLIPVAGLGPWIGTLAIGYHSVGTLGKLSTEFIEGAEPGPAEAMAGVGGGWLSRVRFGVAPQVMPVIMAYWLYRFEINVRASAVIGLLGGGGIGLELREQLFFRNFPRVGTVLILTIAVVLAIDFLSARLRRRIITGNREPGPVAVFKAANLRKKVAMALFTAAAGFSIAFLLVQLQAPVV